MSHTFAIAFGHNNIEDEGIEKPKEKPRSNFNFFNPSPSDRNRPTNTKQQKNKKANNDRFKGGMMVVSKPLHISNTSSKKEKKFDLINPFSNQGKSKAGTTEASKERRVNSKAPSNFLSQSFNFDLGSKERERNNGGKNKGGDNSLAHISIDFQRPPKPEAPVSNFDDNDDYSIDYKVVVHHRNNNFKTTNGVDTDEYSYSEYPEDYSDEYPNYPDEYYAYDDDYYNGYDYDYSDEKLSFTQQTNFGNEDYKDYSYNDISIESSNDAKEDDEYYSYGYDEYPDYPESTRSSSDDVNNNDIYDYDYPEYPTDNKVTEPDNEARDFPDDYTDDDYEYEYDITYDYDDTDDEKVEEKDHGVTTSLRVPKKESRVVHMVPKVTFAASQKEKKACEYF